MLGWQESTLKIHILELYDAFDNLVTVATVSKYKVVTTLCQGCDNLVISVWDYINREDKIGGFSFVHCREIFNTVSLIRSVLYERFHCRRIMIFITYFEYSLLIFINLFNTNY